MYDICEFFSIVESLAICAGHILRKLKFYVCPILKKIEKNEIDVIMQGELFNIVSCLNIEKIF